MKVSTVRQEGAWPLKERGKKGLVGLSPLGETFAISGSFAIRRDFH